MGNVQNSREKRAYSRGLVYDLVRGGIHVQTALNLENRETVVDGMAKEITDLVMRQDLSKYATTIALYSGEIIPRIRKET